MLAQASHAALEYVFAHPEQSVDWHSSSNTIVILAADNEAHLARIRNGMRWVSGCNMVEFYEPDMNGELTAIAMNNIGSSLIKHLPLAGSTPPHS